MGGVVGPGSRGGSAELVVVIVIVFEAHAFGEDGK